MPSKGDDTESEPPVTTRRTALRLGLSGIVASTVGTTTAAAQEAGTQQWAFETGDSVRSSPTVVDGTCFIGSEDNNLYAVDAATGEEQWTFETGYDIKSSPIVVDGTCFVGSFDGNLYAVDAVTGEEQWTFETGDNHIRSSPTVVDETAFVGSWNGNYTLRDVETDSNLYAVDAATGEEQWTFETGDRINSSPTVLDGTVFVGSNDNNLYAVDAETGTEQWAYETGGSVASSPTVVDGTVFVWSRDNNLYAVDAETGTEEWAFETGDSFGQSSPTVVDGTVFVGSWNHNLYAVDAETGTEEWAFETGGSVTSSPTVVDGTVFVGSDDNNLYAVDAETGTEEWAFETGDSVRSSPTVVDGTVFVGSWDGNLYAVNAGVDESSEDSRTRLGTLGHHDNWQYGDQTIGEQGPVQSINTLSDVPITSFVRENVEPLVLGGVVAGSGYAYYKRKSGADQTQESSVSHSGSHSDENEVVISTDFDHEPAEASDTELIETTKETDPTDQFETIESQLDEAREARITNEYDTAIDHCKTALDTAKTVEESAASDRQVSELDSYISEITALRDEITDERDAYQSVTNSLNEITTNLDTAVDEHTAGNTQTALRHVSAAEELLEDATDTATEFEFDTLVEQLEVQQQRCLDIRDKIQKPSQPETIPSPPRLSLTYDAIKKGDPIGSGGNADVYRATATTESGEVELALKEPRMSGTIDTSTIDKMLTEAETWQQLDDHDHIVSVIDYGSDPLPWIAMEYMDGGDLSEHAGNLEFEQALWTALAITKGVRHAHSKGVAHLDLKPENVLLRSVDNAWDVPKVADWGLSKQLLEHSKSVDGMSPHYAAPEQFDTETYGPTDNVTDVYQLGAVFYELFTGRPPFEGQTFEVINKIQTKSPTPPSQIVDVPAEIDDILLTALATEKSDRYDDVLYIRDELQKLWNGYR